MRYLALALLLCASPCWASEQIFMSDAGTLGTGASAFIMPNSTGAGARLANSCSVSASGTLSNLRATVSADPDNGAGVDSYQFDVMDGSATTGITCTIADGQTSCTDTSNTYAITAGDSMTVQQTPSGTPAAVDGLVSFQFDGTTAAESFLCGNSGTTNLSATANRYVGFVDNSTINATENDAEIIISTGGTVKSLYITLEGAPDNGAGTQEYVATVRKNAAGTALTCTISETATSCSDLSNSFTVVAGDAITVEYDPSASAPVAQEVDYHSIVFLATTDGEFVIPYSNSANNLSGTAVRYLLGAGAVAPNATETTVDVPGQVFTVTNMYVDLNLSPGTGASYKFDFRINAADASGTFTCTISGAATTCNDAENISIANENLLDTEVTPTGGPTARRPFISYTGFIAQAARRIWLISQEEECGRLLSLPCLSPS